MLQIQHIKKEYHMGEMVQTALDDVSLNLRDNEFVSILGKSGSGKSTLLNIIGGLDRYDRGDVIFNHISTKNYKDKDWDSYRNHTIGFVFQSYNLIPHQTVLANVELALTISGISRAERQKRAKAVLEQVGLGDHVFKRPNQMSGGQMQRVAIARALINDPDILLADEPTGALDTNTSLQIMELLKQVAKDKLVIMVTHNKELAESYSTRIVHLKDGRIIDDSDPFDPNTEILPSPEHKNMGRAKMSFLTSLSLSFNNLKTKKGRTLLTAFAGSIGIIGIALILALSSSVDDYITNIQEETMNSYPVVIDEKSFQLSMDGPQISMNGSPVGRSNPNQEKNDLYDGIYVDSSLLSSGESPSSNVVENNLSAFKKYLDNPKSRINQYIGKNGVKYAYDISFDVYSWNSENKLINTSTDPRELTASDSSSTQKDPMMTSMSREPFGQTASSNTGARNFSQMTDGKDGQGISDLVLENYELLDGSWPKAYNEVVLVLSEHNRLSPDVLYQLGLLEDQAYLSMVDKEAIKEDVEKIRLDYKKVLDHDLYLLPPYARYLQGEDGTFYPIEEAQLKRDDFLKEHGIPLKIAGIIRPMENATTKTITTPVAYLSTLTQDIIKKAHESDVVLAQEKTPTINVLNGLKFEMASDQEKMDTVSDIIRKMGISDKASTYQFVLYQESQKKEKEGDAFQGNTSIQRMPQMGMDEVSMAKSMDAWLEQNPDTEILLDLYAMNVETSSYAKNMKDFGNIDIEKPSSINIYTDSFENKNGLNSAIEEYNEHAEEKNQIFYTDYVELITSSISTIINTISYILIAFVAVSLVVSSIMIGIITHISVLERTKEIGVLRALGASKENISQVFNAETFIIGCCSGILGILIAYLLTIPINQIVQNLVDETLIISLPLMYSGILIVLSMVITVIGGLLPAKKAAKKDPVEALRTE